MDFKQITLNSNVEQFILRKTTSSHGPTDFFLSHAYPNPFNPVTTIQFFVPEPSNVNVSVFDIQGKVIEKLIYGEIERGNHTIKWNAESFSSGVYFIKLESGDFVSTQKIILMK